jgi:transporter family-2 protein
LFALIGAGAAGSFLAIGGAANARLKQVLHCAIALWAVAKPIAAAAINFIVGFGVLTLLIAVGVLKVPNFEKFANVPWWAFLGGLLGAIFVTLNTLTVPKLGLTTSTLAVVCSQMIVSLAIDHFGWFGIAPHSLSISRVFAIVLLLIAIALTQLDRHHSSSQMPTLLKQENSSH